VEVKICCPVPTPNATKTTMNATYCMRHLSASQNRSHYAQAHLDTYDRASHVSCTPRVCIRPQIAWMIQMMH
jgi:hypothetical protein